MSEFVKRVSQKITKLSKEQMSLLLQKTMHENEDLLRILALFNSIVFDYIVRLKMAGLMFINHWKMKIMKRYISAIFH